MNKLIKKEKLVILKTGLSLIKAVFGPKRIRSKCGRNAGRKIVVFTLPEKEWFSVYTQIVPSAQKKKVALFSKLTEQCPLF